MSQLESIDSRAELLPSVDFTGPRRTLRILYGSALAVTFGSVASLGFIETDVVVSAPSVIIPVGEIARVQSPHAGSVQEILVQEGTAVQKGDPLVKLDPRRTSTRLAMLRQQRDAVAHRISVIEALIDSREKVLEVERAIRRVERAGVSARAKAAEALIDARVRERSIRAETEEITRKLVETDVQSKDVLNDAVISAQVASAQAEEARARLRDLETAGERLGLENELLQRDYVVTKLSDSALLAESKADLTRLDGEIATAELELEELVITAPRAGTVEGLILLDPKDVVAAGTTIARIVPSEGELIVQATVPSDGIAFVRPGQRARIKLDAYPFQDFGVFEGEVLRVAKDAASDRTGRGPSVGFDVRLRVTAPNQAADGTPLSLRPGMTGQAEMVVRRATILSVLLRPLRGTGDSLRK